MIHYLLNNRIIELAIYAQDKPTTDRILIFFDIIFKTYFHWRLNGCIYKAVGVETNRHKLLIFRATGIHT